MRFPEPVRKINGIEVGGTADLSRVVPPIQETEGLGRVAIDGFTDSAFPEGTVRALEPTDPPIHGIRSKIKGDCVSRGDPARVGANGSTDSRNPFRNKGGLRDPPIHGIRFKIKGGGVSRGEPASFGCNGFTDSRNPFRKKGG